MKWWYGIPVIRESSDSLLLRSKDNGVNAYAITPIRSAQGPRSTHVVFIFVPSTGLYHVLYVTPTNVKMVRYPVKTTRTKMLSLVVCPNTGVSDSGRR